MENINYKRLDDSNMSAEFQTLDGTLVKRPSSEDFNNTVGCGYEPNTAVPQNKITIQYKPTLADKLGAVGVTLSKATPEDYLKANRIMGEKISYDVKMSIDKDNNSENIKYIPVRSLPSDEGLEQVMNQVETRFFTINSEFKNMTDKITYLVTAIVDDRPVEIPKKIYGKYTANAKKSTICY